MQIVEFEPHCYIVNVMSFQNFFYILYIFAIKVHNFENPINHGQPSFATFTKMFSQY